MRTGVRLCEADDDAARPAAAKSAQEIRLQAERLALQAEKAALEAEQLTLQAEQLKLATAQRRKETDASGATTPEPAPATESSAKPLDRDPWMADAAQRTGSAPESVSPAPIEASVGGVFNLSLAGPNGSAPLKGQLQQALEIRGLREPSELQLTATQTALMKSEVFDIETFYTTKAPTSTRIRLFLARVGHRAQRYAPARPFTHPASPHLFTPSGRGLPSGHHLPRESACRRGCAVAPNSEALTPAVKSHQR